MKKTLFFIMAAAIAASMALVSCNKQEDPVTPTPEPEPEKSAECTLKSLVATNGDYSLEAEIVSGNAQFTANPEDMDYFKAVTLTATVSDGATTDLKSEAYDVTTGTVTVTVTAEDGTTTKTYNVTVVEKQYTVSISNVWTKAAAELPSGVVVSYNGCSIAFSGTDNIVFLDGTVTDLEGNAVGKVNLTGCPTTENGIRSIMNDENGVLVATFADAWQELSNFYVYAWMDGYDKAPVCIYTESFDEPVSGGIFRFGDCAGALGEDFVMTFCSASQAGYDEDMLFFVYDYGTSLEDNTYYAMNTRYARADGNWSQMVSPVRGDVNGRWFIGDSHGWPYTESEGWDHDEIGWGCYTRVGMPQGTDDVYLYGGLEENGGEYAYGNYSAGHVNGFVYNNTEYVAVCSTGWGSTYLTIQTANPDDEDHYLLPTQVFEAGAQDPYSQYVYNPADDCGYVAVVMGDDGSDPPYSTKGVTIAALYKIERVGY